MVLRRLVAEGDPEGLNHAADQLAESMPKPELAEALTLRAPMPICVQGMMPDAAALILDEARLDSEGNFIMWQALPPASKQRTIRLQSMKSSAVAPL